VDACAADPTAIAPRIALARALLIARRAAEAVTPAEQAAALAPLNPAATAVREAVMAALAQGDSALVRLELTCALHPDDASAQLALGEAYATLDRPMDAERHLKRALGLDRAREAHAALAALYLSVDMLDAAEHHAGQALALDPEVDDATCHTMARQTLAGVLKARGDPDGAARQLDLAYARQSFYRQPAPACPFTTLVLVSRGNGNLPYKALLPPAHLDYVVWYMEHARPEQIAELPPYRLVLNAIGEPDAARASAAMVEAFTKGCTRPVLNAPARVAATARDRLAETLAGIDHVILPKTVRVAAADFNSGGLARRMAAAGLAAPVLIRPAGTHGGEGLVLAADTSDLPHTPPKDGADRYVSRFHDYRSADGFYRKYRMIFVDRRPYPYHLAIGRAWMVHHQTTDMSGDPARMAEELRFLSDPQSAIGARAMAAVAAIGRRLDLDYGGVDFAVTADSEILVFEANATMLTHSEFPTGPFAAKNVYVQPILDAFRAHVARLALG
jgi:tetratricopeptide (TPR) repeat protein